MIFKKISLEFLKKFKHTTEYIELSLEEEDIDKWEKRVIQDKESAEDRDFFLLARALGI